MYCVIFREQNKNLGSPVFEYLKYAGLCYIDNLTSSRGNTPSYIIDLFIKNNIDFNNESLVSFYPPSGIKGKESLFNWAKHNAEIIKSFGKQVLFYDVNNISKVYLPGQDKENNKKITRFI